jgi:hypothetical protein
MPSPQLRISAVEVARQLDAVGDLLAQQHANPSQARAYHLAALDGDGRDREHQYTVVTETSGALRGLRVVRGREVACGEHYARESRRAREDASVPVELGDQSLPSGKHVAHR